MLPTQMQMPEHVLKMESKHFVSSSNQGRREGAEEKVPITT